MRIFHVGLVACLAAAPACTTRPVSQPIAATAACEKLGDTNRIVSDLFASGDVYRAGRATESVLYKKKGIEPRQVGAELYVRAAPGQTGEHLQRTLECYTSYGRAAHPNDPFHPTTGSVENVTVRSAGDSFAIRVAGSDRDAAEDIWRRAQALTSSTVSAEQVSASGKPGAPL